MSVAAARRAVRDRARSAEDHLSQYLEEIRKFSVLSREDEQALARRANAGDPAALETLVQSNLRFVVSVAKKYQHRGMALADLVNEGNVGLLRAAHKFDPDRGIKFISYAVWWIRQAILQALAEQSRIVRIPLNRTNALHRLTRRIGVLQQDLGRTPTPAEIADDAEMTEVDVHAFLCLSQSHLSLDAPLGEADEGRLLDVLPDTVSLAPDEAAAEQALADSVQGALTVLRDREATIIRLYFGLGDGEPMTLEDIGQRLGITRERVRQIKERALARLRHTAHARTLASFLG